jgi:hypothetical protein
MLNRAGYQSSAAIVAELRKASYGWETMFTISDCSHVINLNIVGPAGDEDEWANDMHKLDTILDSVKELRKGLVRARRSEGLPLY